MGGEIGIKIDSIKTSGDIVSPFSDICPYSATIELSLYEGNTAFHICVDNDWGYLAIEVLKPILQKANELHMSLLGKINEEQPEVILLGKNEYRLLDILHIARDGEEGIKTIKSVPIVKGNFNNGCKLLGKKEDLPFY